MGWLINSFRFVQSLIYTTFDGTNEYITVSDNATLDYTVTQPFSISVWVYVSVINQRRFFIAKRKTTTTQAGYQVNMLPTNKFAFLLASDVPLGKYIQVSSSNSLVANQLYHLVATYAGDYNANNCKLYINNVLETNVVIQNNLIVSDPVTNTESLLMGQWDTASFHNGRLDKSILYNKELTAGEVTTLFDYGRKAGLVGISGVVSQWEMNTLNPLDVVGSNHGTSVNMDSSNIVVG